MEIISSFADPDLCQKFMQVVLELQLAVMKEGEAQWRENMAALELIACNVARSVRSIRELIRGLQEEADSTQADSA